MISILPSRRDIRECRARFCEKSGGVRGRPIHSSRVIFFGPDQRSILNRRSFRPSKKQRQRDQTKRLAAGFFQLGFEISHVVCACSESVALLTEPDAVDDRRVDSIRRLMMASFSVNNVFEQAALASNALG